MYIYPTKIRHKAHLHTMDSIIRNTDASSHTSVKHLSAHLRFPLFMALQPCAPEPLSLPSLRNTFLTPLRPPVPNPVSPSLPGYVSVWPRSTHFFILSFLNLPIFPHSLSHPWLPSAVPISLPLKNFIFSPHFSPPFFVLHNQLFHLSLSVI